MNSYCDVLDIHNFLLPLALYQNSWLRYKTDNPLGTKKGQKSKTKLVYDMCSRDLPSSLANKANDRRKRIKRFRFSLRESELSSRVPRHSDSRIIKPWLLGCHGRSLHLKLTRIIVRHVSHLPFIPLDTGFVLFFKRVSCLLTFRPRLAIDFEITRIQIIVRIIERTIYSLEQAITSHKCKPGDPLFPALFTWALAVYIRNRLKPRVDNGA